MNYKDLEIWQISREVVIDLHKMSLELPKYDMKKAARSEDQVNQ
jgi:hypothetical protein